MRYNLEMLYAYKCPQCQYVVITGEYHYESRHDVPPILSTRVIERDNSDLLFPQQQIIHIMTCIGTVTPEQAANLTQRF